ncbi:hypothetical protein RHMOL_Rhmol07G0222400 [Rhododendron molle]|uniref:Uncharacterized protein n=1 Tax=Rhododendron molle TaxID=49168 RepID=A0ACC0N3P7_RHOML|nr:hypothetical protein RHMOL_Rhmol07G0222400 [Rhododendron molle]
MVRRSEHFGHENSGGGSHWSSSELGLVFSFRSFLGSACSQIHDSSHGCRFQAFAAIRTLGDLPFLPSSLLTAAWASVILPSPPLPDCHLP